MKEFLLEVFLSPRLVFYVGVASVMGLVLALAVLDLGFGIRLSDRQFSSIRDGALLLVVLTVCASGVTLTALFLIALVFSAVCQSPPARTVAISANERVAGP